MRGAGTWGKLHTLLEAMPIPSLEIELTEDNWFLSSENFSVQIPSVVPHCP